MLLENGYIGKDCKKEKLYVSPTNTNTKWCNEYLFDYNNVDKERLLNLLKNKLNIKFYYFNLIYKWRKIF